MTLFELLYKKIDDQIEHVRGANDDGAAVDFAAYKFNCGVINGLRRAKREIEETERNLKAEDE